MTSDQVGGIVRAIVAFVLGYFAIKWHLDGATVTALAADAAGIAVVVWSVITNKPGTTLGA